MKTKIYNTLVLLMLIGLIACTHNNANTKKEVPFGYAMLKTRNPELAKLSDWETVKNKALAYCDQIKNDSNALKSKLLLAQLYMQEARITGEHPYYYPAALSLLNDVIKRDPENFEAYAFKASVLLSLHHFNEALRVGTKATMLNSYNSFVYGVLCDANVEMGNYEEAVKMSDKMQSLRPGLESYARVSYLREIYGDNAGAIEAMKMAYQAGLAGSEEASWAANTLTNLYINTGNLMEAESIAQRILEQRPSYAFATNAMGLIEMAKGQFDKAILNFDEASSIMPEVAFYENKAEALKQKGNTKQANELYKTCITMLNEDAQSGHQTDMEKANIFLELGEVDQALSYAKIEFDRRPNNIDANHTMAWVYYSKGNFANAKKHMDKALRMGTKGAKLMAHAAAIEKALGNNKAAEKYLSMSKKINPNLAKLAILKS